MTGKSAASRGNAAFFRKRGSPAALAASAALLTASCFAGETLTVADSAGGAVYARWPVEEGTEFFVEFIHSVNQSPVREVFEVRQGRIAPVAVEFHSFGAGMQSELAEGQTLSREEEGALRLAGLRGSWQELSYIVGTVSDHVLGIHGRKVSLRDLCGKNAHITLQVR